MHALLLLNKKIGKKLRIFEFVPILVKLQIKLYFIERIL